MVQFRPWRPLGDLGEGVVEIDLGADNFVEPARRLAQEALLNEPRQGRRVDDVRFEVRQA
jgi:hypothetical protein